MRIPWSAFAIDLAPMEFPGLTTNTGVVRAWLGLTITSPAATGHDLSVTTPTGHGDGRFDVFGNK